MTDLNERDDESTGAVERADRLVHEVKALLDSDNPPYVYDTLAELAGYIMQECADQGVTEVEDCFNNAFNAMKVNGQSHMLLQFCSPMGDDRLTVEDKARFLWYADVIGPDNAQFMYHAAVFMTRVA